MLPAQSFLSGLQAISNNDVYYNQNAPCLQDIVAWKIVSIVAAYGMDINGNKVPTFQILYQEMKKKKNSVIQFPRPDFNGDNSITALKSWFDANVPGHNLNQYNTLICIDKVNVQSKNINGNNYSDVLLNDTMVSRREWDPYWVQPDVSPSNPVVTQATHIYMYQGNENDYKAYTVLGNQSLAGAQYYVYY